ncbi:antitoxin Xre/MbcA/ParS-like domain-containing protein [Mesorhizobium marinum]|uniref:antitoxin Xre/MbcA/ParS-like domain-containing protein n=1 Tax=Mesorhizobium marinum TaxID=3228790 RepID=UPI0034678F8D
MAFQSRRHLSRQGNVAKRLSQADLRDSIARQIESILVGHDPTIRKPALLAASRLAGSIAASIAVQTQIVQRAFPAIVDRLDDLSDNFVASLVGEAIGKSEPPTQAHIASTSDGEATLALPDDWAGPVAGPTILERRYGMARSTLFRWMKRGEAVSLRTSGNRPVFPLKQFVDGRPADGIPELVAIFGDARRAWLWLVSPCAELHGNHPIDELVEGRPARAIEIARQTTKEAPPAEASGATDR